MKDTIYREDAIKAFDTEPFIVGDAEAAINTYSYMCDVIRRIKNLPPAQPDWIPCSKILPKDDTEVIVSCTDDSGDSEYSYTTTGWHFKGVWVVDNERNYFVRAWMPLPKSYSERRQE